MNMHCKVIGLTLALVLACGEAAAQNYPNKPVKWIVGFAAGGGNDVLARAIAPKISEQLGQQFIIENKTGAEGRIAADFVAKAAPDGYTIMSGASGQMVYNVGLFAPAGTPRAIIDKLYSELSVVLKSDALKERFAGMGQETRGMGMPPAEFDAFFRAELAKWTKAIKDLNIRGE